jgi:hypothetical protein
MDMRRIIYVLIIIFVLILVISISLKPIIISLAKAQLSKVFIDSKVSIRGCNLKLLHVLTLSGMEIKKGQIYDFKIKEVNIQYKPLSIINRNISKISLKDALIIVNLRQDNILGLSKHINLQPQKRIFLINLIDLSNLDLDINSTDLILQAKLSVRLNLAKQLIDYLNLQIDSLKKAEFRLQKAYLEINQMPSYGQLYIEQFKYNKVKIDKITSIAKLKDKSLFLGPLTADVFGGSIEGEIRFEIEKNGKYFMYLKFKDLDLNTLINDFNLNEKVQINGRLDGAVTLKGIGLQINVLDGDFTTAEPGGTLTIKDTGFLEKIARNSNQPLDILVESFKDYHYNNGVMRLSLEGDNLILVIDLEGETGKRNLNIIVHNFKLRREK